MHAVFVAALLSCAIATPVYDLNQVAYLQTQLDKSRPVKEVFEDFKRVFSKKYEDEVEEETRRQIFQINVAFIQEHNKLYARGEKSYTLGVNEFTDLTHKEFLQMYTGIQPLLKPENGSAFIPPSNIKLPSKVDWRDRNYVTPIKNQGQCGSCWSFSTTGSVEGQYAKKTGRLVSLSEQQLVDCSTQNHGCKGGLMDLAFKYIKSAGGLESEAKYPYRAVQGTCKYKSSYVVSGTKVTGYHDIPKGSESALQQAVATVGPISVAIDANHRSFQLYRGGIYDEPSCSSVTLDHGVLAIGYGSTTKDYWLVKNSWGTSWGEQGYIRMTRNKGNQCGIATMASYPDL